MYRIVVNRFFELELSFPYRPDLVALVKDRGEFPNYQPQRRVWLLPPTEQNLRLAQYLTEEWNFSLSGQLLEAKTMMERFEQARIAASMAADAPLNCTRLGGTLRPFQRAGSAYMTRTRRCLVADEMGLGKTVETLATLGCVSAFPAVVVCPASLQLYWQEMAGRWLPGRRALLAGAHTPGETQADIWIVSYAALSKHLSALQSVGWRALVCDEAHYLKNGAARRTQAVRTLARGIPYRFLLTGTPVLNRPNEIVPLLHILGILYPLGGNRAFLRFVRDAGPQRLEEVHARLRVWGFLRRTRAQVLPELPAKERVHVHIPLADPAAYAEIENHFWAWAQARGENANPLVRLTRLRQEAVRQKLPAIREWLQDFLASGEKVVVFGHHREALSTLGQAFDTPVLDGGMPVGRRQALVQRFQTEDGFPLLLSSLTVGGVGWTLTAAHHAVFIELDWTPARHEQAEDRLARIGQEHKVTLWYLLARDTIDEDIWRLHRRKRQITEAMTDGNRVYLEIIASMARRHEAAAAPTPQEET